MPLHCNTANYCFLDWENKPLFFFFSLKMGTLVAGSIKYFFYLLIYLLFCQAKNIQSTSALNILNLSKIMYRMRSVRIKLTRFILV